MNARDDHPNKHRGTLIPRSHPHNPSRAWEQGYHYGILQKGVWHTIILYIVTELKKSIRSVMSSFYSPSPSPITAALIWRDCHPFPTYPTHSSTVA